MLFLVRNLFFMIVIYSHAIFALTKTVLDVSDIQQAHLDATVVSVIGVAHKLETGECEISFKNFTETISLDLQKSQTGGLYGVWANTYSYEVEESKYSAIASIEAIVWNDGVNSWVNIKGTALDTNSRQAVLEFGATFDPTKGLDSVSLHGVGPLPSPSCANRFVLNLGNVNLRFE